MAVEKGPYLDWSSLSSADLTEAQYTFVEFSDVDHVKAVDSVDDFALGILQNSPAEGDVADVRLTGISKVKLGGTVALNDGIGSNASGLGVKAATGKRVYGRALEAGVSGQIISVAINFVTPTAAA
ncbi:hypothetical protein SEA_VALENTINIPUFF_55 [Microbacterium phage ValentiniPuff]|uniref:Uncharacterized protein n=1 Tax=Microbacterium phage ValentiniPuff TaxID=2315705 RepID=A0A386KPQ8_9CAUD|nr:hypothetical protein SEA_VALENTINIPUFF_55 [Microbacterium phage ValentiniPuff]